MLLWNALSGENDNCFPCQPQLGRSGVEMLSLIGWVIRENYLDEDMMYLAIDS